MRVLCSCPMKRLLAGLFVGVALCLSQVAQAQTNTDLNSGGLAPPPPVESTAPPVAPISPEDDLKRADKEDSGRGLEFVWLNAEGGYQNLGLQTFHANNLVDAKLVKSTESGFMFGAGAGVRLLFLTLGARFRLGTFDSWQLWTLNAELGLHLPFGRLEPYFTFGGGYASLGSFNTSSFKAAWDDVGLKASGLDIRGYNVRGGFGMDYYVANAFSVGANVTGDLMFLSRPKSTTTVQTGGDPVKEAAAEVYARDGSSVGGALAITAVLGLHF